MIRWWWCLLSPRLGLGLGGACLWPGRIVLYWGSIDGINTQSFVWISIRMIYFVLNIGVNDCQLGFLSVLTVTVAAWHRGCSVGEWDVVYSLIQLEEENEEEEEKEDSLKLEP